MTSVDPIAPAAEGELTPGEGWAEAGAYDNAAAGFDHGLVALSMGFPYVLREKMGEAGGGYSLLVPPEAQEAVREQVELFDRENAGWPPAPSHEAVPRRWSRSLFLALVWAWAMIACFAAQQRWPELTAAAAMDARAVFSAGEWWRPVTALFLHANTEHLISNLVGGVFLFAVVLSMWGWVTGVALLGVSATLGNLLVGATRFPEEYRSLGASTALFAALGMLTGRALRVALSGAAGKSRPWRTTLAILGAGVTALMLYGGGEAPVDVPAHGAGFAAGAAVGFVFAALGKNRSGTR
jgi:membrane associated rhomboid family serine protease